MRTIVLSGTILACAALFAAPAQSADLYARGDWAALATNRAAHAVGDTLTILVYETSAATNTASSASDRSSTFGGHVAAGSALDESGSLSIGSGSSDSGSSGRSGGMVAQISAVVDAVLPNGDLHVTGAQVLNINGDRTEIHIKGRVRPADISPSNVVLSSRLADATIDYDGTGFVSRSARPGLVNRIFTWFGL